MSEQELQQEVQQAKHKRAVNVVIQLATDIIAGIIAIWLAVKLATPTGNPCVRVLLVGVAVVAALVSMVVTYRHGKREYYWPEASECVRHNILELATWFANDPQFNVTEQDRQAIQDIRDYMRVCHTDLQRPMFDNDAPVYGLCERLMALRSADTLMRVFSFFNLLMLKDTQHWREFNETYRDTMRRVSEGEDITGKPIHVLNRQGQPFMECVMGESEEQP